MSQYIGHKLGINNKNRKWKFLKKSACVCEKVGILIPVACNGRAEALESN